MLKKEAILALCLAWQERRTLCVSAHEMETKFLSLFKPSGLTNAPAMELECGLKMRMGGGRHRKSALPTSRSCPAHSENPLGTPGHVEQYSPNAEEQETRSEQASLSF